jgi:S1-C subfamily serine protease
MVWMLRALVLVTLLSAFPRAAVLQAPVGVLQIKVVVPDADGKPAPVPRHALLISDNPATSAPRRVVTGLDGIAVVRLRPGNYTVESDTPLVFRGQSYEWRQVIDIVAGRDDVVELTAANAEIGAAAAATASGAPVDAGLSSLLIQWEDSVVALWTPVAHASGFVIDAGGLVVTSQRAVGTATSIEMQLAADVKVPANVLASDAGKDVAVLFVAPALTASLRPVPLGCEQAAKPTVKEGDELVTIGAPLRQPKGPSFGTVTGVEARVIRTDFLLPEGSGGGPVFAPGGAVVGMTSVADGADGRRRGSARIVRLNEICEVVASAQAKMKTVTAPSATRLPIEPSWPFPEEALKNAAQRRVGSLNPYQISSTDFDIAFITPVMIYGAQYMTELMRTRDRDRGGRLIVLDAGPSITRPVLEFGNWSEYVADFPPVLLVRVTPKLIESFWAKVARGAASTQGMALPPIKRIRSGFLRMRAFCGDAEVTPIHPFKLEQRVSDTEAVSEGLYVFDPGALAPSCAAVKLVVYSEKEPEKADTRVLDAKLVQQIWQDFEPYRQP